MIEGEGAMRSAGAGSRRLVSDSAGGCSGFRKAQRVCTATVSRWLLWARIDSGRRFPATSEEMAAIQDKDLKANVRRLEDVLDGGGSH